MQLLLLLAAFLASYSVNALTFASAEADAKSTVKPAFPFPLWDFGAIGVTSNSQRLGSDVSDCYVWSVGPRAFVWARHVSPQPDAAVIYRGVRYELESVTPIGSDVVLGIIKGQTPTWGAVWKGFGFVTNKVPSGWPPGFGMPATVDKVETVSIAKSDVVALSAGPGGIVHDNEQCLGTDTRPPAKRWASVTNCGLGVFGVSSIERIKASGSTFEMDIIGPEFSIPFGTPQAGSNPGAWTGDSGGGVFIRDTAGDWRLIGLMHAGGSCRGNSIDGAVVNEASFLNPEFWSLVGNPSKSEQYKGLRSYFADAPRYEAMPTPTPAPVQPPPQPPPVSTITLTNTVTIPVWITNTVTVTNAVQGYFTTQQRQALTAARNALQWALDALTK